MNTNLRNFTSQYSSYDSWQYNVASYYVLLNNHTVGTDIRALERVLIYDVLSIPIRVHAKSGYSTIRVMRAPEWVIIFLFSVNTSTIRGYEIYWHEALRIVFLYLIMYFFIPSLKRGCPQENVSQCMQENCFGNSILSICPIKNYQQISVDMPTK